MESKVVDLETKIAFQEDLIEQLNQALISQQDSISRLELRVELLVKAYAAEADSGVKDISLEVPPPHY